MRALLFTDLHAHNWSDFSYIDKATGLNSRLLEAVKVIREVKRLAEEQDIGRVVFLGDLFHVRGHVPTVVMSEINDALSDLAKVSQIHILVGNHDQQDKDGKWFASKVLSSKNNVYVVLDEYTTAPTQDLPDTALFNYDPNPERFLANLKTAKKRGIQHLFVHAGIHGAATGPRDYIPKEEIHPEHFEGFRKVFSGHYHKHQDLNDIITYVGTPLQHYRSERDYTPGVLIYDYDTNEYEQVVLDTPRFVTWETGQKTKGLDNNYVDIILKPGEDPEEVKEALLKKISPKATNVIHPKQQPKMAAVRLDIDTGMDEAVMLEKYVTKFGNGLDKDRLLEVGRRLAGI